ncbi:MAG: tetratricopeptide repeat protein, partial [Bacillota bacterium]|nr:tetratricopeptide repeat protein [Bacillota bacterium]
PYYKSEALVNIARALAQAGNNEEAVKIAKLANNAANSITDSDDKARALVNIARALAQAGNNEEAVKIANLAINATNSITEPYFKAEALAKIVTTLVENKNITSDFPDPGFGVQTFSGSSSKLSTPQSENLLIKATVSMLMEAKNPWDHFDALLRVAKSTALAILPLLYDEKGN